MDIHKIFWITIILYHTILNIICIHARILFRSVVLQHYYEQSSFDFFRALFAVTSSFVIIFLYKK